MQVQNINNINFKGGFRLPSISSQARVELDSVTKRGKQIFDNFEKEGDTFVVVRDKLDKKIFDFIRKFNLNFEYYPLINTNCHLDAEIPQPLSLLLKDMKPKQGSVEEFIKSLNKSAAKNENNYMQSILNGLNIKSDGATVTSKQGIKYIKDADCKYEILISPADSEGAHYVRVDSLLSSSDMTPAKRYKMTPDGEIIRTYNEIYSFAAFNSGFKNTLKK